MSGVFWSIGSKADQALVTGDLDWRDARIEASVRQLIAASSPGPDDEYAHTARSGVMVRMWTVRHYYYLLFRRAFTDCPLSTGE